MGQHRRTKCERTSRWKPNGKKIRKSAPKGEDKQSRINSERKNGF